MALRRPAVFIDKDGTLLENVPYNVDPARIAFTPNAVPGLRLLSDAGYELVLVSNQSGVARGYFDESALWRLLDEVAERLAAQGVQLLGSYYCPHHPGGTLPAYARDCDCRKPSPGLLMTAAEEHDLDPGASWLVGDILDDIEAGHRAGCRAVLLDRGSETEWRAGPGRAPDCVAVDLLEAARMILAAPTVAGRRMEGAHA